MPFTVSHTAAIIPLRRFRKLPLTALIVGAMAPDFEFFLRVNQNRVIGHSFAGIFVFCIPVGLAALALFHKILKFPLISLLPAGHQVRLFRPAQRFAFFPVKRFAMIVLALFIGTLTHLFWDAWSHQGALFVRAFPVLQKSVVSFGGKALRLYDLVQHSGTVLGVGILVRAYLNWYRRVPVIRKHAHFHISSKAKAAISSMIGVFSCAAGIIYGCLGAPAGHFRPYLPLTFVAVASAFLAAWTLFSLIWHMVKPAEIP